MLRRPPRSTLFPYPPLFRSVHAQETTMDINPPPPPPEGCISCEVRGHVLLIGINRPAKRNGWTPPMFQQLAEAYTRLDDDPELRVGVLHAFGSHFTAGAGPPVVAGEPPPGGEGDPPSPAGAGAHSPRTG